MATYLRRDTTKAYPTALSWSKPVLSLPKGGERLSRSRFDRLATIGDTINLK
ncbi:MAG: hypothetical protein NTX45_07610 [Proteobacteria bacterium]|nr:hypothetical protein [Pseudomonadota bacterium]